MVDLTDAYLHVQIHPLSRKYLRFMFEGQVFQFTVLPFRMAPSPWILTKLMDVIASHMCQRAISVFRLACKRSNSQLTNISHQILPTNSTKSRFHSKFKKVGFDTSPEIHVYRDGISDTIEYSPGTTGPSWFPSSDYQTISFPDTSFGLNLQSVSPICLGKITYVVCCKFYMYYIAPVKALFLTKKYCYFSYFSKKPCHGIH